MVFLLLFLILVLIGAVNTQDDMSKTLVFIGAVELLIELCMVAVKIP